MKLSAMDFEEEEAAIDEWAPLIGKQPPHMDCYPCALQDHQVLLQESNKLVPGVLQVLGVEYHLFDFVYIRDSELRLDIAQITDLLGHSGNSKINVELLERVHPGKGTYDLADFVRPYEPLSIEPLSV
jgi:hypothetical protein